MAARSRRAETSKIRANKCGEEEGFSKAIAVNDVDAERDRSLTYVHTCTIRTPHRQLTKGRSLVTQTEFGGADGPSDAP